MKSAEPIRYRDDVETELRNEAAIIDETIETMRNTLEKTFEVQRHATAATHAKSHGIVTGRLNVPAGLPVELAQGMFAAPGTFDVVIRYASEPGQVDPDTVQRARGLALKVLDVPGEKLRPEWTSQDFLFNTWPVIAQGDAATYLKAIKQRDKHFAHPFKVRAGTALRHPSPKETLFDLTPNINPVAHIYYSQSAFRYGDYVAKFSLVPVASEQLAAGKRKVSRKDSPGVLRNWVREYYARTSGRYELRVQLCTNLKKMPIEDASVEWKEKSSPYRTVATIDIPPQETFSPARRVYAEDVLSWRPWYGLTDHRPLGSINRVRRKAYEVLGAWRHDVNAVEERNPISLSEIPD